MMTDMRLIQDEKRDVFIQLEELHTLLDEKEEQLRSFIRQYENQMQVCKRIVAEHFFSSTIYAKRSIGPPKYFYFN